MFVTTWKETCGASEEGEYTGIGQENEGDLLEMHLFGKC